MKEEVSGERAGLAGRAKGKVFYGWYIVGAYMLINVFIFGVMAKGMTTLINPIATTFGWSYATISLALSLRSVETGVLAPLFGRAVDRWPAKRLILIGLLIEACGYFLLSQTRNLPMFFISILVTAFGSSLGSHMAPTATIARWFKKNVGKVNGMVAMGIGLGGYCVPVLVWLIDAYSWRTALIIVSIGIAAIGVPLAFVFRDRPEDYGLFPDGIAPDTSKGARKQIIEFNPTVKEAVRTRAFWQLGFAETLHWANVGAVTIHVIPYLTSPSVSVSRSQAAMVAMFFLLVSVPARFMWGWLADIFQKRYITAASIALMAVGMFFFSAIKANSFWLSIPFIIIYGIGLGGATPMRATLIREYFGTKHFGSIFGLQQIFMTVSAVIVPPLAGWVYDTRGNYDPTWTVLASLALISTVLMFTMPVSERHTRTVAANAAKG